VWLRSPRPNLGDIAMTTQIKNQPLDKNRILELLAKADTKWFDSHRGQYKYREHLEFVAEYVAGNYHKKGST